MFHATRGPEIFACGNLAAFRLTMIYLPQDLLLKWVVVKYSGVPFGKVAGSKEHPRLR